MMDLETLKARNEEAAASAKEKRRKELTKLLAECPAEERSRLLAEAIFGAFTWDGTPEGGDFWCDIFYKLAGIGETTASEEEENETEAA